MRRAIAILGFFAVSVLAAEAGAANCGNNECHRADGTCVAVSASACAPKQDTYVCVDCTATAGPCRTAACQTPGYTCAYTNLAAGTSCGTNMACDGTGVCKCSGCIDSNGVCQPGNTAGLCGTGGGQCKVCTDCASGGSCVSGVCSGGTAINENGSCWNGSGTCHAGACCTTCWNGTSCVSSTTATSCGAGGGPCRNCSDCRTGVTSCNAGVCTGGTPGLEGAACAAGAGICHGGNCCTGCWDGTQCRSLSGDACGSAGGACTNCNTCKTGATCSAGACTGGTPVADNTACVGTSGTCHAGDCCTGCWDGATSTCQPGTAATTCGGAGQACLNCADCQTGASCTGGACTGGTKLADGTTCQGTYACCDGSCNVTAAQCCYGAGRCLDSLGQCVDGTQVGQCGTNGTSCQDCTGVNECGNTSACTAGACVSAVETAPPSACAAAFAENPPQTSVQCDFLSTDHCATFTRTVASADCRGVLTHNAYPAGFAPESFLRRVGVTITPGSIAPTGLGSPAGRIFSRNLSREISSWAADEQQWMVSRVHIKVTGTRAGTCVADDYLALYLSLDETSYHASGTAAAPIPIQITPRPEATEGVLPFLVQSTTTSGGFVVEQVYDVLTWGHAGARVRWGADFYKVSSGCTLAITGVDVGYQAMRNDFTNSSDQVYKLRSYSSLIPLANMMYFGALETRGGASEWPGATGGDLAPRGHLIAQSFYDPADPTTQAITKHWDAGEELQSLKPMYRRIFTADASGGRMEVSTGNSALPQLVLPGYERSALDASGNLVFDFNGDGTVTDADATEVINWTRGCQLGTSGTCGTVNPTMRPWVLGAIDRSTPAIVGPPNMPWWLNGLKVPAQLRADYWTWAGDSARANRDTIAYVGSQDGMIHAFYAGQYKIGDDATTAPVERRGYFYRKDASSARDYGGRAACLTRHGSGGDNSYPEACPERFAYVPRALLPDLRNNVTTPAGKAWTWRGANHPRTVIESSPAVEDVAHFNSGTGTWEFRTTLFSGIGPISPYLIAVDVTNPSEPQPLWERTYANFRGTLKAPPTPAFARVPVSGTSADRHILVMTSGYGWNLWDPYMLFVDAWTGDEIVPGGVRLNPQGAPNQPPSYGTLSSPLLLDMEGDGYVERAYVLDTGRDGSGNLFTRVVRVSIRPTLDNTAPANPQVCEIFRTAGSANEGAFGGLAGYVCDSTDPVAPCTTPKVRLYFGTSDDPRWDDSTSSGQYHLYAIDDLDVEPPDTSPEVNPSCVTSNHLLQFRYDLETGGNPEKTWLTPAIDYEYVYFATLRSPTDSECDWSSSMGGRLLKFDLDGSGEVKGSDALTVQPVGGVRVYDQHVFMGTTSGQASITAPAGTGFNNAPQGIAAQSKVQDDYWLEK